MVDLDAIDFKLRDIDSQLDGVMQDMADLLACLDDETRPDDKGCFETAGNREHGFRNYLDALGSLRAAQTNLLEIQRLIPPKHVREAANVAR